jgi:hexosaminidase
MKKIEINFPNIHCNYHIKIRVRICKIIYLLCFFTVMTGNSIAQDSITKPAQKSSTMDNIIPRPVSVIPALGSFTLSPNTVIYVSADSEKLTRIGQYLADKLNPSTGYNIKIEPLQQKQENGNIFLTLADSDTLLGQEGYNLVITKNAIYLSAFKPAGLFHGIQTIRQLLPPKIESKTVEPGSWKIPAGTIRDYPRFGWRGAMLDVARHFFSVEDVKQVIDLLAYYKINRLHLHLADDQGWRIMINSWPNLATYGGSTEVGGGKGGYYTQEQYSEIVKYASDRYIMIVPEIDMPGHVNAALASYAELNCDSIAPPLYTGTRVGHSKLCVKKKITYNFIDDVIKEISSLTPAPYMHIGGDEALSTDTNDYKIFIKKVETIVEKHHKHMIGWDEITSSKPDSGTIVQHWNSRFIKQTVQSDLPVIMSPASRMYLDMKYNTTTKLGLKWAGYITVKKAYDWDPATFLSGMSENRIMGIESPLWTETVKSIYDIEYMMFPRICGFAEIGWSHAASRNWDEYRIRLSTHSPRLKELGVNFYRSPLINWK